MQTETFFKHKFHGWFFSATQSVWSSPSGCEGNRQNANSGKLLELYGWGLKTYKYSVGTSAMFSTMSIFFFYFSWPRQSMWNIHGKSVIRWIPSNSSCWTTTTLSSVAEISPQSEWHHVSGKLYARYRKWEPLKVTQKWQCYYLFWIFSRLFNILWIFLFCFLSIIIFFFTFHFSWVYETRSKQSGLTVLEIDIPTGYVIMNDTLRALVNSPSSPSNLKRAEFYKRKVVFYFEYVSKIFLSNIPKRNFLF